MADGMNGDRPSRFTNREKMQCAQREAGFRRFVYPKRIAAGKMRQAAADKEIALMDEIALHFGRLAEADEQRERLL